MGDQSSVVRLRLIVWYLYLAMILIVLLPLGSVNSTPLHLSAVVIFAIAALTAVLGSWENVPLKTILLATSIALLFSLWTLFQSFSFEGNPLANPIWASAADIIGPIKGSISVEPTNSRVALITTLMPFAMFIAGLLLLETDSLSIRLLGFELTIALFGAVIALVQLKLFPTTLLFSEKKYYLEDL